MSRSFYQFAQTKRNTEAINSDPEATLAELIFLDGDFPKSADTFQEVSDYVELNSRYSDYVAVFDQMWEDYTH